MQTSARETPRSYLTLSIGSSYSSQNNVQFMKWKDSRVEDINVQQKRAILGRGGISPSCIRSSMLPNLTHQPLSKGTATAHVSRHFLLTVQGVISHCFFWCSLTILRLEWFCTGDFTALFLSRIYKILNGILPLAGFGHFLRSNSDTEPILLVPQLKHKFCSALGTSSAPTILL